MKTHFALIFLSLCASAVATSFYEAELGAQATHLEPIDYPPDAYDERVARALFVTDAKIGRIVIRPSFDPELCISIHSSDSSTSETPEYFITLTAAEESLYYTMEENNDEHETTLVHIVREDRQISLQLATAIQRVLGKLLHNTRYPSEATMGLDGVTYQFSTWVRGLGTLFGQTWSPDDPLLQELLGICEELALFTQDNEIREEPLIRKLQAIETKIPEA